MRLFLKDEETRLDPEPFDAASLRRKPKFKMRCARYVEGESSDGILVVRMPKNYRDFGSMASALSAVAEHLGTSLKVDPALDDRFTQMRELAEERYRVGNEIKRGDHKYDEYLASFQAIVDAAMVRPLKDRQVRDAFFLASMRRAGNFSVPGSGKTATVLGAFAFLADCGQVRRLLVICPKNAFDSWRTEWEACFGYKRPLSCFSSQDPAFTQLTAQDRQRYIRTSVGANNLLLVNYESTPRIVEELAALSASDTMLVYDEVHRVKSVTGKYAAAALTIAERSTQATIALTGTPLPNTYEDLYNFLHILYPREYDSFFGYECSELKNAGASDMTAINERIQSFYCRTSKADLGVPPADADELISLASTDAMDTVLNALVLRYKKNALTLMLRVLQLESDPAELLKQIDPEEFKWLIDGDDVEDGELDVRVVDYSQDILSMIRRAAGESSPKRRRCISEVANLVGDGNSVIVWCIFKHSMRTLAQDLHSLGIDACVIDGDVVLDDRDTALNAFRAGTFKVLVTNPHTLAESVSLHMVCHHAIYYEYSYNLVHLLQSKDRIHRLGLSQGQHTHYQFLVQHFENKGDDYSMDERIYSRLREKEQTMMDAIEGDYIETQPTAQEDLDAIFEGLF